MSDAGEEQERPRLTLVPDRLDVEPKRNKRRPRFDERSRRGIVTRSTLRRRKAFRSPPKGHERAGHEERAPNDRLQHSRRKRVVRRSGQRNRSFLKAAHREVRTLSPEQLIERFREGKKYLNDLRIKMELRYWEPFLDGYYTERAERDLESLTPDEDDPDDALD